MGADAKFGTGQQIDIRLPEPHLRHPPKPLNQLGIPQKNHYRTADVCTVLGIRPDLLRYRFYTGQYPEVAQDGKGTPFLFRRHS